MRLTSLFSLSIVFLFMSLSAGAQNKLTLGLFASLPTGDYKSTSLSNGSFAELGWGVSLEYEAHFKSWPSFFGLLLHTSYQNNTLNNKAMGAEFSQALEIKTEVSEASFHPIVVTLGPVFNIPVSQPLKVGIKTGIGLAFTNIDSFNLYLYNVQNQLISSYAIDFQTKPNFTFLLGCNTTYTLSPRIQLAAFADYSAAREQVNSSIESLDRVQSYFDLSFVNVGIGMVINFN